MLFLRTAAIALGWASAVSTAAAQVPPAPIGADQVALAERLRVAFAEKDVAAYGALLADEVTVEVDGKIVAKTKQAWLRQFGPKLSMPGVSFKLEAGYASPGRILFVEYFNSAGSWRQSPPPACCSSYDAVAYDVSGGKIRKIVRLRGGSTKMSAYAVSPQQARRWQIPARHHG